MLEATSTLVKGMQFLLETGSGHAILTDTNDSRGGCESAPTPLDLLVAAAAGCTSMTLASLLRKMGQKVSSLQVKVNARTAEEHPIRILEIHIEYFIHGFSLDESKIQRAIDLADNKYCPVITSLRPGALITSSYQLMEASEENLIK